MSSATSDEQTSTSRRWFDRTPWNRGDLAAVLVWSLAILWAFWSAATLRGALFYFDITEINYPYRAFFAEELWAGRFSRWCPWLYCGMPLYSESQAGYLHPLKYLLYPWMATWKAFNLDTVLSIWLTGMGTYGWLRRHVRPAGALTGAALFGLGGFTWAHLVHTSMINALASVPIVVWSLEWSWETGRWRGVVIGAAALACQVFAGHLQDVLLTSGIVITYGLYRFLTEPAGRGRWLAPGMPMTLVALGALLSAVQWVPSKELLDRSPRAGGLSYEELTYASWSPELLPTLIVREAYGTRARDTDWMNGFYPYHGMDSYLGLLGLALAVIGAGGVGARDRWANFGIVLVGLGGILMLGRFTCLFDYANRIPIAGSSREPVRFHLWVSLGVAMLAAVGVERLSQPGAVRLRGAVAFSASLVFASIPILLYLYAPVWTEPNRWTSPYHLDRYRWLGRQLTSSCARDAVIMLAGLVVCWLSARSTHAGRRAWWASLLPLLVLFDLGMAHEQDAPTVPPTYWTSPPETVQRLKADPSFIRVFGDGDRHSGEPGYASEPVDFMGARDPLDWSLPAVWGLRSAKGETPMIARRLIDFYDHTRRGAGRFDLESVSHVVTGRNLNVLFRPNEPVGSAFIHRNPGALPRARLAGRPVYVDNQADAIAALERLGPELLRRLVVEDHSRPISAAEEVSGTARIVTDLPESVVIEAECATPAYLVLADTYDPGWTATVDGRPAEIRPAYVAFRAVALDPGRHTVQFSYRPAGFAAGMGASTLGLVLSALLFRLRSRSVAHDHHAVLEQAARWRRRFLAALAIVVLASAVRIGPGPSVSLHERWNESFHRFTWGAGLAAMKSNRQ
jgi:hypothetical protein